MFWTGCRVSSSSPAEYLGFSLPRSLKQHDDTQSFLQRKKISWFWSGKCPEKSSNVHLLKLLTRLQSEHNFLLIYFTFNSCWSIKWCFANLKIWFSLLNVSREISREKKASHNKSIGKVDKYIAPEIPKTL